MWQCTLDAQKGLDVGNTYRNVKACREFVHAIVEVERCYVAKRLEKSRFHSLISDGTTNSPISQAEIVFVWYSVGSIVATAFVGVENFTKADVLSIMCAID